MTPRDFGTTLRAVIDAIPADTDEQRELRGYLEHELENARYTAPEALWSHCGARVTSLLVRHLYAPRREWGAAALLIWVGQPTPDGGQ